MPMIVRLLAVFSGVMVLLLLLAGGGAPAIGPGSVFSSVAIEFDIAVLF